MNLNRAFSSTRAYKTAILAVVISISGVFVGSEAEGASPSATFQIPPRTFPTELPEQIFGLPTSPEVISVLPFAGRWVLWLPVLMDEPNVPIEGVLLDPLAWEKKGAAEATVGRRSLWFMEPGTTMLYGVIIDPASLQLEDVGVAYVMVKRLDEKRYDILVEDTQGGLLVAARGALKKLDESIGAGTLIPVGEREQRAVRKQYGAEWNVGPEALFLFTIPTQ